LLVVGVLPLIHGAQQMAGRPGVPMTVVCPSGLSQAFGEPHGGDAKPTDSRLGALAHSVPSARMVMCAPAAGGMHACLATVQPFPTVLPAWLCCHPLPPHVPCMPFCPPWCLAGYSVDISLPHLKLAIEADGPSHFSRTPGPPRPAPNLLPPSSPPPASASTGPPVLAGPTAMKRRHLRAMGWALVSVPFTVRACPLRPITTAQANVDRSLPAPFSAACK